MSRERPWEQWWKEKAEESFPRQTKRTKESPMRRLIVEAAAAVGETVLDVGCATCIDYPLFKELSVSYIGVDITEKFVIYAKKLYPEIDVRLGSILDLSFEDNSIDVAYTKSVIEHLHPDEWGEGIKELWRVAKKRMILGFYIPPWDKPAEYFYHPHGFWKNTLNHQEVMETINSLGCKELMVKNISVGRAYIVDK